MADESTHNLSSQRLERLAWYLDSAVRIPGTQVRLGLDPLIGLVPLIGDSISALISCYILNEAAQMGIPRSVLIRMGINIVLDATVGAIPLIGDIFDVTWRANRRNVQLLQDYQASPRKTRRRSRFFGLTAALLLLLVVVGAVSLVIWLFGLLWQAMTVS